MYRLLMEEASQENRLPFPVKLSQVTSSYLEGLTATSTTVLHCCMNRYEFLITLRICLAA